MIKIKKVGNVGNANDIYIGIAKDFFVYNIAGLATRSIYKKTTLDVPLGIKPRRADYGRNTGSQGSVQWPYL